MRDRVYFEYRRSQISALHTERHAHLVEGVIKWARPARILEVGAYRGYMSATILRAMDEAGMAENPEARFDIIDSFHDYRTGAALLERNINSIEPETRWRLHAGSTLDPHPEIDRIDMAVIDADHSYEWALRDTMFAISRGAWLLMWHDSHSFEGVRMTVDHVRLMPNWGVVELPFDAGYALAIERFDAGPAEVPKDSSYTF